MSKHGLLLIISFIMTTFFYACKTHRDVVKRADKIDNLSAHKLVDSINGHRLNFEYFASKLSVDLTLPDDSKSFKATLRIRKDSIIWIYIMKTIPVASIAITRDSVKVVDKINKKYFVEPFLYINEMFNTDLDYGMLQDLLTGDFIAYNKDQKYKEDEDTAYYFLSSIGKRKLRRAFERDKQLKKEPYVYRYWINPGSYRPAKTIINDLNDTTSLEINNSEFEKTDSNEVVPYKMAIKVSKANAEITIELKYSKTKVNEKLEFPFNIPDGYERKE